MEQKLEAIEAPTPKLGIIKGILMILVGYGIGNIYIIGANINLFETGNKSGYIVGIVWSLGILGVCAWRGIVAIVKRKKKKVTYLTVGFWGFLLACVVVSHLYIGGWLNPA